jgi:hypothetical protein
MLVNRLKHGKIVATDTNVALINLDILFTAYNNDQGLCTAISIHYLVLWQAQVRVQSDPAGRLVISGEPEHADNPWGVTPSRRCVLLLLFVFN